MLLPGDANSYFYFGNDVAISDDGETLVISSYCSTPLDLWCAGSAYVFIKSEGQWVYHQTVTADEPQRQDYFGAPTLLGDTMFISAYAHPAGGYNAAGAVYVFTRPPGSDSYWTQHQKLTASNVDHWDYFGVTTAADGETLVVGAQSVSTAYVFDRNDGGDWVEQQILQLPEMGGTALAYRVAIDGDTIMVGALQTAHSGFTEAGAVFVFTRSGGTWTQQQMLTAPDPADGDFFGEVVEVSGNIAVIGATWDDLEDYGDEDPQDYLRAGSVHIFERTGGTWVHQQKIHAREPMEGGHFGKSVALADRVLLIGSTGFSEEGAAYVFTRFRGSWIQRQKISALLSTEYDAFGQSVCIDGETAIIGAPYHNHSGLTDAGAAYIMRLVSLCPRRWPGWCQPWPD
jgi:hypothetical protein